VEICPKFEYKNLPENFPAETEFCETGSWRRIQRSSRSVKQKSGSRPISATGSNRFKPVSSFLLPPVE
jgi:hypothetical protein